MKKNNNQNKNTSDVVPIKLDVNETINADKNPGQDEALRKMIIISIICIIFLISEVIGGIISNSLAILTDAAHLCSDLSGFIISIIALYIGKKKPNKTYTYGYYRAEVLGALLSVVTIWILTGLLLIEAYDRLLNPSEIKAGVMLLIAILGLMCNLVMMKVLHSGGHAHGHGGGCSHGHGHNEINLETHVNLVEEELDQSRISLEDDSINDIKTGQNSARSDDSNEESEENNHTHVHGSCNHVHNEEESENKNKIKKHKNKGSKEKHTNCDSHQTHDHTTNQSENEIQSHSHDNEITHDHSHEDNHASHDHAHSHEQNVNLKAALIHVIGDIIQSVGVVIAAIIIYLEPTWVIVDPLCTFVFSIIVLFTTYNITKQCLIILLEATPDSMDTEKIEHNLKHDFMNIISIHSLHVWTLSSSKTCITLHAVVNEKNNNLTKIKSYLKKKYKFVEITIQFETKEENLILQCVKN